MNNLATIDWVIIVLYLALSLGIALKFSNRAGKSLGEFFLGGRSLPWWVLGVSMVATTFAADTPLAVSEIIYTEGISGNWIWWCALIGGMLTTFFFAKLWRRANILTEVEFIDIRYSGMPARFLRGFKAVYLGVIMNVMIMGWVNLAMMGIFTSFFGLTEGTALMYTGGAMLLVAIYSSLGGLLGVAITDMVQFLIAMAGSIILAVLVLNSDQIGGMSGLQEKLGGADAEIFRFIPRLEWGSIVKEPGVMVVSVMAFFSFIAMQWWASWYPGAEPGGGGYIAQRMMSARSEKDSILATLFFQVAHYALRPWPWIIVGLCTVVLYPGMTENVGVGYVHAMKDFLPDGLRGLLLVAFLAAYMSTISTQLNWGASYIVNDLYKPFIAKGEVKEKQFVNVSRIVTVILMIVALAITSQLNSIKAVWDFVFQCGAGLGLVLILRWFWWRINAWAEIVATFTPFLVYMIIQFVVEPSMDEGTAAFFKENRISYYITISLTTIAWIVTTFVTRAEPMEKLRSFYTRVRPGGWWGPVVADGGLEVEKSQTFALVVCWFSAVIMTYSALFGFGELIFGNYSQFGIWIIAFVLSAGILLLTMKKGKLFE